MRILYIECNMGAAGDMLMAALSEVCSDSNGFFERINAAGIPNTRVIKRDAVKCGIHGTGVEVVVNGETEDGRQHHHHDGHHHHSGINDISHIISHMNVPESVKKNVLDVYRIIAEAESKAHGVEVSDIHFHEVGTMDAVADITGVCMLMEEIGADRVVVSPINVGFGEVECAHGILPVPAPATAHILMGAPIYSGSVKGELCTPTGAALLRYFADEFGEMPLMRAERIGYGMGKKDFSAANCVRVILGETRENVGSVIELCANIDDITGEEAAFAAESLLEGGAYDAFWTSVGMKKGRPGIMLTCVCGAEDREKMLGLIFRHTTTIGVRERQVRRHTMDRSIGFAETEYGRIRIKKSEGFGVVRTKAEYEDMARIARENNISIPELKKLIAAAECDIINGK